MTKLKNILRNAIIIPAVAVAFSGCGDKNPEYIYKGKIEGKQVELLYDRTLKVDGKIIKPKSDSLKYEVFREIIEKSQKKFDNYMQQINKE